MPVRAWMCWERSSARTICSVKFFEPTTSRGLPPPWQPARIAHRQTKIPAARRLISSRRQTPLGPAQARVGENRQQRRRDGPRQNHLIVHHRNAAKDERPQPARADGCGNGADADGNDGGNTEAREDYAGG